MKRTYPALAITAALALSGCTAATTSNDPPAASQEAASGVTVPDVTGMAGDDALEALTTAGFIAEFDGGDDVVIMASNWTVDSQTPAAGESAPAGSTVKLSVSKPESEPAPVAPNATSSGLTATYAQAACDMRGQTEFPYGWDPHWVLGKLAEEIQNDRWYLKATADVKNEYNAERAINFECYVSGTNDAPMVDEFLAY